MKLTQKALFRCLAVCLGLLINHQVLAVDCGQPSNGIVDSCHHHSEDVGAHPIHPGCEQLQVTINNNTAYTFKTDSPLIKGSFATSATIAPGVIGYVIQIAGTQASSNQLDQVSGILKFVAHLKDSAGQDIMPGAQFTLTVEKSSCNVSGERCLKTDSPCYCRSTTGETDGQCVWNATCDLCTYCSGPWYKPKCVTEACKSDWDAGASCDVTPITPSSASVTVTQEGSKSLMISSSSTVPPYFTCNKSTVCQGNAYDSSLNPINTPASVTITIDPSRIETLTITFPFNTQTPIAKILKDSIYNNLNSKYVGQLGSYFSYSPVEVGEKTLAFSTLCNAANCP